MNQHLERLEGLAPFMTAPVLRLLELSQAKLGKRLLVVWGYRSYEQQMQLYQAGRRYDRTDEAWVVDEQDKILTNAKPGLSAHNVVRLADKMPAALAVDVIPFTIEGKADWNVDLGFWDKLYEISWKIGLDPLGDPIGAYLKKDRGHFEEPAWKLKLEGLGLVLSAALPTEDV